LFDPLAKTVAPSSDVTDLPEEILWLLDAPLFIDGDQVEAFYDAVLRPDFAGTSLTLSNSLTEGVKLGAGATLGANIPWLVKTEGTISAEGSRERGRVEEASVAPVVNPFRHLLALAIHYATETELKPRLVLANAPTSVEDATGKDIAAYWAKRKFTEKTPRAVMMLDLPPGAKLIPAALELSDGVFVLLYEEFGNRLCKKGKGDPPRYPGSQADQVHRDDYWRWFARNYDDREALNTVEAASKGGTIQWIAFRVPLANDSPPFLHLHLRPGGTYEAGVFAYPLISRGNKHGLRMVGTLKSEPDLNVLAVYER
jgi:hypothetical protein